MERDCRVPLIGMLRASGCVAFDVSIVGGRIYPGVLIVNDLLMFLVIAFQRVWMSGNSPGFLMRKGSGEDGGRAIVSRRIIVFL